LSQRISRKVIGRPVVYVVLPVHDRREITRAFVRQLLNQTYDNYRLILIDDGSTDGTAEVVLSMIPNASVLRGDGSWWWAGALQRAHDWLEHNDVADSDIVLIMNDDTTFHPDFIVTGLHVLEEHPETLLTATGYNVKTGRPQDTGGYFMNWADMSFCETRDNTMINCTSTRGLMARVVDFLAVGGFHPVLIPHYLSDLEFTMRAKERGKTLMINENFRIGIDFETTGIREVNDRSLLFYLKKTFSVRAATNPVYWSSFILLRSPWKFKLSNLGVIWGSVLKQSICERLIPFLTTFRK
jgi:GT2 family glycosyltransferase